MPRPEKPPADRLDKGVTVLFTQKDHAAIKRIADRQGISMGEAVRRLVRQALTQ